jgi:putative FmdB family regulatory protein
MPIYEYRCNSCGHHFDYLLRNSSPPPECPECHAKDLEQQISLCAVSSDTSRAANLNAAHSRAAVVRKDRAHQSHTQHHEHFEDPQPGAKAE